MALSDSTLAWIFSILIITLRLGNNILTPLFLDSLNPTSTEWLNVSSNTSLPLLPSSPAWQTIDPFVCIWFSMGFDTVLLGTIVASLMLCWPGQVTARERSYPKSILLLSGACQAVSALMYQFSTSGTRTAPYLFGALGYFYIPIAFALRFAILKKRPTRLKMLCAVVVLVAEFISLIPVMFPRLESDSERREEGGASGIGRILWPVCYASSGIPHAIWNILLEKSVKQKSEVNRESSDIPDIRTLNMSYIMFWTFLGTFSMAVLLFWIDLIPGFGMLTDIRLFGKQFVFNMKCLFGAAPQCGFHQLFTGWGRMICKTAFFITAGHLLRYGDGASLYAIISAPYQPLKFLFFTLFDELPFRWRPHASLGTWLNLGALVVMVPTVVVFLRSSDSPPAVTPSKTDDDITSSGAGEEDRNSVRESFPGEETGSECPLLSARVEADRGPRSHGSVNSARVIDT